jgi:hypothetical protein
MNMICMWVHGDDGALVTEWAKADDSEVDWGLGILDAADAFEALEHNTDALTPIGV